MWHYIRKMRWSCAAVCCLQIALWGLQTAAQLLLMQEFDAAIRLNFPDFLYWAAVNICCWGAYFLVGAIQGHFQAKVVGRLNTLVRRDMLVSLSRRDFQSYHSAPAGDYISWFTNDISQIEKLAWEPFFECVGRIAQVCWSVLALASLHWSLLLSALLMAAVMWLLPKVYQNRLRQRGAECEAQQAQAVGSIQDLLLGLDVLRAFGHKEQFVEKGVDASKRMEKPKCRLTATQVDAECFGGICSVFLQALSSVLIVALALAGKISLGTLGGGTNLIAGVTNGLDKIAALRLSISAGLPYFEKIEAQENSKASSDDGFTVSKSLELENVSFSYGDKQVLHGLSLRFEIGKKYALTGASGCGKSTVLKLLLGWLPGYTGEIRFDGRSAREYTPEQVQEQMSYIEQDVFLFNTTIRENITLGEDFSQAEMDRAVQDSALIDDLAAMPLGLDTPVGENGSCLSGGQKQRVAIARALIHHRSILLVDEGTSALDQANADLVEQSLLQNPDLTLILVSHHLSEDRKRQFDRVYEL